MNDIKISEEFKRAAKEAAKKLLKTSAERIFMEKPFEGFFVTRKPAEEIFKIFSLSELGVEKSKEEIFVICENFLGKKKL